MEFCWNFVSLQVGMNNLLTSLTAVLLVIWYSLSVIGFDVHTCSGSGESYVTTVIGGTTCDDIHPEHDCCGHGACCTHHTEEDGLKSADNQCCTNEIEVLDCEVVTSADEDDHVQLAQNMACVFVESNYDSQLFAESSEFSYRPDPGRVWQPDCQALLNIWRI